MANNLVSMQQIRVLIQYLIRRISQRKIASDLHISRLTIRRYTQGLLESDIVLEDILKTDDETLSAIIYAHKIELKGESLRNKK
jgi:DNA-binding transcriptional regulator LsrR (DeoR family)